MRYKILIVDDHMLVREGLAALLSTLPGGSTVHTASNAAQALEQAELHTPFDAVLLDCGLPDANGASLIQALRRRSGSAPVIIVSGNESVGLEALLLQMGASAFVSKGKASSAVVDTLMRVLAKGGDLPPATAEPIGDFAAASTKASVSLSTLTGRQLDVLLMLDQGLTNREISLQLGLSEKTVKNHITALFAVMGSSSRLHAIRKARDLGLLT